jgi:hypothetical protein
LFGIVLNVLLKYLRIKDRVNDSRVKPVLNAIVDERNNLEEEFVLLVP